MSQLHSESTNRYLQLTVRVKFLDLNKELKSLDGTSLDERSQGRLGAAILSHGGKRQAQADCLEVQKSAESLPAVSRSEICVASQEKVMVAAFEEHLEFCSACANRVDLQLDFMECLEAAVYQRLNEPESRKIHGALMVSAPKFNFAICGELEVE